MYLRAARGTGRCGQCWLGTTRSVGGAAMNLRGKIALVNGAWFGIGQDVAEELARAGADVVIPYYRGGDGAYESRCRVQALDRRALVMQTDPEDPAAVAALFEGMEAELGPPD